MNVEKLAIIGFVSLALLLVYVLTAKPTVAPAPRRELGVVHLDAFQLFDGVITSREDPFFGGPNHKGVVWAVFFYRPYCGACRRVRPAFEALAQTTNTSLLRFAAMDCTKYKHFCDKHGGEKQPRIVLFSYAHPQASSRATLAVWEGMLIATDVIQWFKDVQKDGGFSNTVEWASNDELAKAMRAFKATGEAQYDPLIVADVQQNRSGYLRDIQSALSMGLTDHVFQKDETLRGARLRTMIKWIAMTSKVYPEQATRQKLESLRKLLVTKDEWHKAAFEGAVRGKFDPVKEDDPEAWVWCTRAGPGVGGYPCGLWVLFHTLMANSDKSNAEQTLATINLFISNFFGCEDCARHFDAMWKSQEGASKTGHIDTVIWLWKAHNRVRARLMSDDTTRNKEQWPSVTVCPECYTEEARNGTATLSTRDYIEDQWRDGYVFEMLQEAYCYQSDLLACAQFWDPSARGFPDFTWKMTMFVLTILVLVLIALLAILCANESAEKEAMPVVRRVVKTDPKKTD